MKNSTGSLNATVVTLIAVGVLIAFFYYTIWPLVKTNFKENSECGRAICEPCNEKDSTGKKTCEMVTCHSKNDPDNTFQCVWTG